MNEQLYDVVVSDMRTKEIVEIVKSGIQFQGDPQSASEFCDYMRSKCYRIYDVSIQKHGRYKVGDIIDHINLKQ